LRFGMDNSLSIGMSVIDDQHRDSSNRRMRSRSRRTHGS
jgi:hypothetical protein